MNQFDRYRHLLWISLVFAFIGGISAAMVSKSGLNSALFIGAATLTGTLVAIGVLVAAWSVLGPGALWIRAIISMLLGLVPFATTILCFVFNTFSFSSLNEEGKQFLLMLTPYFLFAAIIAQIPYWFFRVVLGWQIIHRDSPPTSSVTLGDLFVIITLFAIAIAIPKPVAHFTARSNPPVVAIGDNTVQSITRSNGDIESTNVLVTEDNIQEINSAAFELIEEGVLRGFLIGGIAFVVISLLSVPIIWLMLRVKDLVHAWMYSLIYGFALLGLVAAVSITTGGGAQPWTFATLFASFQIAAIALPLFISRRNGFRLVVQGHWPAEDETLAEDHRRIKTAES